MKSIEVNPVTNARHDELVRQRARKILQRQRILMGVKEYVYGALFCLMAVFGFMLESDGRTELVVGIVGMMLTLLVILLIHFTEEEDEAYGAE